MGRRVVRTESEETHCAFAALSAEMPLIKALFLEASVFDSGRFSWGRPVASAGMEIPVKTQCALWAPRCQDWTGGKTVCIRSLDCGDACDKGFVLGTLGFRVRPI